MMVCGRYKREIRDNKPCHGLAEINARRSDVLSGLRFRPKDGGEIDIYIQVQRQIQAGD
jgi:hypothetical protein